MTDNRDPTHIRLANGIGEIDSSNPLPVTDPMLIEIQNQNDLLRQILMLANGMQSGAVVDNTGKQIIIANNPTAGNLNMTASIAAAQTLTTVGTVTSLSNLNGTVPASNIASDLTNIAYSNLAGNIIFNP